MLFWEVSCYWRWELIGLGWSSNGHCWVSDGLGGGGQVSPI